MMSNQPEHGTPSPHATIQNACAAQTLEVLSPEMLRAIDIRVASERIIFTSFAQLMAQRDISISEIHEVIAHTANAIIAQYRDSNEQTLAIEAVFHEALASNHTAEQFVVAVTQDNQPKSVRELCGFLSRLLYWGESAREIASIREGKSSAEQFLIDRNYGALAKSDSIIELTPLYLNIKTNGVPEEEMSTELMGRSYSDAPVILITSKDRSEQNRITEAHEQVHYVVKADRNFYLPCPIRTLLNALKNQGYIEQSQTNDPDEQIRRHPKQAVPLDDFSGALLLDLMHEEIAAQGIAGMSEMFDETDSSPERRSEHSILGSISLVQALAAYKDTPQKELWVLTILNSNPSALSTFGTMALHCWMHLFSVGASALKWNASVKATDSPTLPGKAAKLLHEFVAELYHCLSAIRDSELILRESSSAALREYHRALYLALPPSQYRYMPELLRRQISRS